MEKVINIINAHIIGDMWGIENCFIKQFQHDKLMLLFN